MGDWAKLSSVDEFQHLFASSQDAGEGVGLDKPSFLSRHRVRFKILAATRTMTRWRPITPQQRTQGCFRAVDAGQHDSLGFHRVVS